MNNHLLAGLLYLAGWFNMFCAAVLLAATLVLGRDWPSALGDLLWSIDHGW
jgi:hypothetical protein